MITLAVAQEFSAQGGTMGTGAVPGTSYSWQLAYRMRLTDRFAWSAAWINEGHTATHHRDGLALLEGDLSPRAADSCSRGSAGGRAL